MIAFMLECAARCATCYVASAHSKLGLYNAFSAIPRCRPPEFAHQHLDSGNLGHVRPVVLFFVFANMPFIAPIIVVHFARARSPFAGGHARQYNAASSHL